MTTRRVLLYGDSHVHAIKQAVKRRLKWNRPVPVDVRRVTKTKDHQTIGDTGFETILDMISQFEPRDLVVSAAGGSQHAVFSTIQHPQPFDFLLEDEGSADLTPSAEIIPLRLIDHAFGDPIRKATRKAIAAFKERTSAKIVFLAAPPPKADNEFIRQHHDTRFAADGIVSLGVSPPRLRMKFWKLQTRAVQQVCNEHEVELLRPPAEALDHSGFLLEGYSVNDATHANAEYGELVIRQLERLLPDPMRVASEASE